MMLEKLQSLSGKEWIFILMFFHDEDDFLAPPQLLSAMNGVHMWILSIYKITILVFKGLVFQRLFHQKKRMIL